MEAPAQGAISAASFVKLMEFANPVLIYDLGCRIIDHIGIHGEHESNQHKC